MNEASYRLAVLRFPGNSAEHPGSSGWVMKQIPIWEADPRIAARIPLRLSDTPITMARNRLVREALARGADYILMIDSDIIPDVEPDGVPFWDEAWSFLMERRDREGAHRSSLEGLSEIDGIGDDMGEVCKAPTADQIEEEVSRLYPPATVAAPYCGPAPDENVFVARWYNTETNSPDWPRPYRLALYERDHAALFAGVMPAAALPTGLILYDARVFRVLPPPWFYYEWTDDFESEKASTEDFVQTRNASILRLPQFCAWSSWAGHCKAKVVRKPRALEPRDVPLAFAEAVRKDRGGPAAVRYLRHPDDLPSRPALVPPPPPRGDTLNKQDI